MIARPETDECLVLHDVPWQSYEKLLAAFAERRFPHTYADGTLEITTLSQEHEWLTSLLARFIGTLSIELKIRITSAGSTTLRRALKKRGLEPDESYYVANYTAIRGLKRIDLNRHPPPDLVVEVDVTHKSLAQLENYAQLGVPEIWRHDRQGLRFLKRVSDSQYRAVKRSLAFSPISSDDLQHFLDLQDERDEYDIVNSFIDWARKLSP